MIRRASIALMLTGCYSVVALDVPEPDHTYVLVFSAGTVVREVHAYDRLPPLSGSDGETIHAIGAETIASGSTTRARADATAGGSSCAEL